MEPYSFKVCAYWIRKARRIGAQSASPNYTVTALSPTVFTDYYGVGHGSGPCISGSAPACPHCAIAWVLHDPSNALWNLTLGNYEEDYPVVHPLTLGGVVGPLNTAAINAVNAAVPEPSTWAMMILGFAGGGKAKPALMAV
jgi:hypothetical protein